MIRKLQRGLGILADILIQPYHLQHERSETYLLQATNKGYPAIQENKEAWNKPETSLPNDIQGN
jgi:hypothetical protein